MHNNNNNNNIHCIDCIIIPSHRGIRYPQNHEKSHFPPKNEFFLEAFFFLTMHLQIYKQYIRIQLKYVILDFYKKIEMIEYIKFLFENRMELKNMYCKLKTLPVFLKVSLGFVSAAIPVGIFWINVMQPRQKLLESIMKDINSNNDGNLTRYKAISQYYKNNGYIYKDKFSRNLFVKFASQKLDDAMTNNIHLLFHYYTNGNVRKALETGARNNGIPITYAMFSPSANSCEEAVVFSYLIASHIARLQNDDKIDENEFYDKAMNSMNFYKKFGNDFIFHLPKCTGYFLPESEIVEVIEEIKQKRFYTPNTNKKKLS